jgi:hypothetical protein
MTHRLVPLALLLAVCLVSAPARADPTSPAPRSQYARQRSLERTLTLGKVGVVVGIAVLAVAVGVAYRITAMCAPDDDDCPIVRSLAYLGDGCLAALGLGIATSAAWSWGSAARQLRAGPLIAPLPGGATLGLAMRF